MGTIFFSIAFDLVSRKLSEVEIAKRTGISHQTISRYIREKESDDPRVRLSYDPPHPAIRDLFVRWYTATVVVQDEREGIQLLLEKYVKHLPSTTYAIECYDEDPESWIEANLPWLFSGDFYWKVNKFGQTSDVDGWNPIDTQDYRDYIGLYRLGRIKEIIGLALLGD